MAVDATTRDEAQADAFRLMQLIRIYMSHGHLSADLDPLNMRDSYPRVDDSPYSLITTRDLDLLNPAHYGFHEEDMERTFNVDLPQLGGLLARKKQWKLREILDTLKNAYCQKIGVEYMHVSDPG